MRFNFVGKIGCNDMSSKVPYYKKIEGYDGHSLNLICIASNNNRSFLEIAGFKNDTVKYYDNDGNEHEIDWNSRLDEEVVKSSRSKNVISLLDGTRKEFISAYDFVKFVADNVDKIKDKRFVITGSVKKNEYKGKITDRFTIQSMYEIEEEDERKNQLRVSGEFFFNKDSLDTTDFAKKKKIYLNGYTKETKDKKPVYMAKQIVIDCNKIDFDNENHVARLNFQLMQIGCALDDNNKVVNKLKKKFRSINVNLSYQNGNEIQEFDESQLTKTQKTAIELGISKLEDFRPANQIYGERIVVYKFKSWDLRGNYSDGSIEAEDDVEEMIYTPVQNQSVDDFEKNMNKPEEPKAKKSDAPKADDEDDDDLFSDND